MTKATRLAPKTQSPPERTPAPNEVKETPFEAIASICSVLVVGLFILTFLAQNYVIPSGSMENTLLVGDHLIADQITLMPPALWMPLIRYREPRRGDIVVFHKPVYQPGIDQTTDGTPKYIPLVKRLIGVPGDHIHLRNGIVFINGIAQSQPHAQSTTPENFNEFLDDFPAAPPAKSMERLKPGLWPFQLHSERRSGRAARHVLHDG